METQTIYAKLNDILSEPRLQTLYRKVESSFKQQDGIAHNWEHVRRDIVNVVQIGLAEHADMSIVMPAMILHDLGYLTHPQDPGNHPVNGSKECYAFLSDWTPEERDKISSCILKHKGKFPGFEHSEPETLEEKVVCDADQVDKFGWVGFMQMMRVYIEHGTKGFKKFNTITGLAKGILAQGIITLYTETGKRMAAMRRHPDFKVVSAELSKELSLYDGWKETF